MRGTTMHAKTLGMQIIYQDDTIQLTTPFGSSINLCTDQESHLRSVLREAARHAALTALQQRIDIADPARVASTRR